MRRISSLTMNCFKGQQTSPEMSTDSLNERSSVVSVLKPQINILTLFGLLPSNKKKNIASQLPYFLCLGLITGCYFCVFLECAGFYYVSVATDLEDMADTGGRKLNPLIRAFGWTPFIFITARAGLVLTIFLWKRDCWSEVTRQATVLTQLFYGSRLDSYAADRIRWKRLSWGLLVLSVVANIVWEVLEWLAFLANTGNTMYSDNALSPLPWNITMWEYLILWLICDTIPFILSQVIFSVVIVLGSFTCSCLASIVRAIKELQNSPVDCSKSDEMAQELIRLHTMHYQVMEFGHLISHTYGLILFFIYGLDVLAILGFVGRVILPIPKSIITQSMLGYSIIVFAMYSTAYLFPLVQAHEQVHRINDALYSLSLFVAQVISSQKGYSLRTALQMFLTATKERALAFHAVEIIHITRTFLVATFTLVLSFAVLAYEFVEKTGSHGECPAPTPANIHANETEMHIAVSTNATRI